MEIFGGFMVMMSIVSLFLAVVWLIMPFVVFAIKGKQDRALEILEAMEKRLATIESRLQSGAQTAEHGAPVMSKQSVISAPDTCPADDVSVATISPS